VPIAAFVASSAVQAGYNLSRGRVKATLVGVVGALDDAVAIWDALFPGKPVPPSLTASADLKREDRVATLEAFRNRMLPSTASTSRD
jgi:hypothetical protein